MRVRSYGSKSGKIAHEKCSMDGFTFDSRKELERYIVLKSLQRCGRIEELTVHPRYEIIPAQRGSDGRLRFRAAHYTADFRYKTIPGGQEVVEDVKSDFTCKEKDYILRRKLMLWVNGVYVEEVR